MYMRAMLRMEFQKLRQRPTYKSAALNSPVNVGSSGEAQHVSQSGKRLLTRIRENILQLTARVLSGGFLLVLYGSLRLSIFHPPPSPPMQAMIVLLYSSAALLFATIYRVSK